MEYVYMMKNMANGYYKIGRSNNPRHREGTLHSEEPDVRLLATLPGSRVSELELQRRFKSRRLRGEWFRLNYGDLFELAKVFDVGCEELNPPFRSLEDEFWQASFYRCSPHSVRLQVFARRPLHPKARKFIFEVPFELTRGQIDSEVEALLFGCKIPYEMHGLLAISLRNYVRASYPSENPVIELRELCCMASGESRGFQVFSTFYGDWFFRGESQASVLFERWKKTFEVQRDL